MMKLFRNSRGISSAEAMLSISCFALVAYFIIDAITKQNDQILNATAEIEVVSLLNEIRVVLSDPLSCSATFGDIDPRDTLNAVPYLLKIPLNTSEKNAEGTPILATFASSKQGFGPNGKVKILRYSLDDSDPKVGLDQDSTYLKITFDKSLSDSKKSKTFRRVKLFVQTKTTEDGLEVIDQCSLNDHRQNKKVWEQDNAKIYYDKGFVGVGSNFPTSPLTINGILKLGSTNTACTPDRGGSIRYNRILQNIEFCRGNGSWQLVGEGNE